MSENFNLKCSYQLLLKIVLTAFFGFSGFLCLTYAFYLVRGGSREGLR